VSAPAPRSDGRYQGAITARPLPETELDEVPWPVREALAKIWFTQAATELRVARSFEIVHASLDALGADPGLVRAADRAIDDEHRHTALCLEMAKRFANNDALPHVPELEFEHPRHPTARSDAERRMLFVIGQCSFNETFASAYLSLARAGAEESLSRAAIAELLADEVDHARLGWAYLSTMPQSLRARLLDWVHPLAMSNLRVWRTLALNRDVGLVRFGVPEAEAIEVALRDVLAGVIVPGLAEFGVESRALQSWIAEGAPT
jgi:hypothetical protein